MTIFCLKKGSLDKSFVLSLLWDLSLGFVIYGRGLSYVGGICHMWGFVICWWDLSNVGGRVCHIWVGFVNCGGVCHIWVVFVKYGRDLSPFCVCHFLGGICHICAGFVTGFVTKIGEKSQKVPICDKSREKSLKFNINKYKAQPPH